MLFYIQLPSPKVKFYLSFFFLFYTDVTPFDSYFVAVYNSCEINIFFKSDKWIKKTIFNP